MFEFDRDTRVTPAGDGRWQAVITDRWNIGRAPHGGYLACILLAAASEAAPHPDPFAVTTNFLARTSPGEATVEAHVVRAGGTLSTVAVRLLQDGEEALRQTAVFGDFAAADGPTRVVGSRPEMMPAADLPSSRAVPGLPAVMERFDFRMAPSSLGGLMGAPTGAGKIEAWVRFGDGREPDLASLVAFADAGPPAVLNLTSGGWVPTIELSVHLRRPPAPGWLQSRFVTRYLIGGYLEEDGELWDSAGELVALSRQFARVHPPRKPREAREAEEGGGSDAAD